MARTPAASGAAMTREHRATIVVPANETQVRIVRLVATAVLGDLGLPVEEVEALRLVVTEVVTGSLRGSDQGAHLAVRFTLEDGQFTIEAARTSCDGFEGAPVAPSCRRRVSSRPR